MLVVEWSRLDEDMPLPMLADDLQSKVEQLCEESRKVRNTIFTLICLFGNLLT